MQSAIARTRSRQFQAVCECPRAVEALSGAFDRAKAVPDSAACVQLVSETVEAARGRLQMQEKLPEVGE
eukprot:6438862-Alexandrium_andersonii.AAC.1